jgi:hypothetical protein
MRALGRRGRGRRRRGRRDLGPDRPPDLPRREIACGYARIAVLTGEEALGGQGNDGPFGEKDLVFGLVGEVRAG